MAGQGEQGERVVPKRGDEPLLGLDNEASRALVNYPATVEAVRKANELFRRLCEILDEVDRGLPLGYMVMTYSESRTPYSMVPEGHVEANPYEPLRGSLVYRPDENGTYIPDGEIVTSALREPFLGDRIMVTDDNIVVVINTELGVGLTASSEVAIVDMLDSRPPSQTALFMRQFATLMDKVDQVKDGASEKF